MAMKVARQVVSLVSAFVLLSGEHVHIYAVTIQSALSPIIALTSALPSFVIRVSKRLR